MNGRLEHYVSQEPFHPEASEKLTPEQERYMTSWEGGT